MENEDKTQPAEDGVEAVEEFTLAELLEKVADENVVYYCVDGVRDGKSRRKLFDPMCAFTSSNLERMRENWNVPPNTLIRVTTNPDLIEKIAEADARFNPVYYLNRIYRLLIRMAPPDGKDKREEIRQLIQTAVKLLDQVSDMRDLGELKIRASQLRTVNGYFDHLVNVSVLWLMTFAHLNAERSRQAGAVEMWKSTKKEELRKVVDPKHPEREIVFYYDFMGRDYADDVLKENKKRDLGLALSGFFAALFHDFSLLGRLDSVVIVDPKSQPELKDHSGDSNKKLKDAYETLYDERPLMRNVIKNHHERIDGSGYPSGKKDQDLHLFSNILGVVDVWDEFCLRFVRSKVLKYIALGAGKFFPGEVCRSFLNVLQPFDLNERVKVYEEKLADPVMTGQVVGLKNPRRPELEIVEVYDRRHADRKGKALDLADPDHIVFSI